MTPAPELLLTPPPGFVSLPLRDPDTHTGLPRYVTWFAQSLPEETIRLYGRFAVEADAVADPVLADLAAAVVLLDGDDSVARLRQRYRARHPHADVRAIRLATGPAIVAVTAGEYRLPPDLAGHGVDTVLRRITAEFQIPAPDGAHLALMTVSTANEAGCQAVLTAAMRVANSIRVTRPQSDLHLANPSA